ncbi:uncharacterized protein LOC125534611 [Triticum urartu]|uniref:uncharacterized protein LOC125534608 n=1 Tax=Triticum urartu TaxID=4572 RepID=UPI002044544E|nr:uncharacterized protein LOC125534608 [Triticum urartu]XP_048553745.1 uncharacterized protein LOC125534611 [Triticum urartu]
MAVPHLRGLLLRRIPHGRWLSRRIGSHPPPPAMAASRLHRLLLRWAESCRRPAPVLTAPWPPPRLLTPPVHHRALPVVGRLFRPTGGRRYDVFWALGRGPGGVLLLLPQVVKEQYCQAGRTPFLCSKPLGAVGMQAIRPLSTGVVALLRPLATGAVALLHCHHRLPGTRFYLRLPQVNRAAFSSLLLTKLLDVEVIDD